MTACAILGWFASLVRGRMPKGLRDAGAYGVGYSAQMLAYLLFVTDRYPNADPTAMLAGVERPPEHPVRLVGDAHDLRRSRAHRLLPHPARAAAPHLARALGGRGRARRDRELVRDARARDAGRARCTASCRASCATGCTCTRSSTSPRTRSPASRGAPGSYPLDLELPAPGRQNRWKTGFRIVLVIPAAIVNGALAWGLFVAGVLTWFAALVKGAAPWGLRNLMAYALRYDAQVNAYGFLLTDAYPHASPLEGAAAPQRTRSTTRRERENRGARGAARRPRGGLGGRRVPALAVVGALVAPAAARRGAPAVLRGAAARGGVVRALHDARLGARRARAARRLRPLRVARRAVHARVGGRADRHGDAARDDRLRARLDLAAAVRLRRASGGSAGIT